MGAFVGAGGFGAAASGATVDGATDDGVRVSPRAAAVTRGVIVGVGSTTTDAVASGVRVATGELVAVIRGVTIGAVVASDVAYEVGPHAMTAHVSTAAATALTR